MSPLLSRAAAVLPASPRWRRLVPALVTLAASLELFASMGYGAVDRAVAVQVEAMAERVRADQGSLRRWLRDPDGPSGPARTAPLQRTDLLRLVDAVAGQSGARILRLTPRPGTPNTLDVEMSAGLSGFAQFAAAMEARRGRLQKVQVRRPDAPGPRGGDLLISFVLEAPRLAVPQKVLQLGAGRDASDPFAPLAASAASSRIAHRLTAVTRIGDELIATIDGRDYHEGDALGGARILAVKDDAVQLASGPVRYWLRLGAKPD